MEHSCHRCGAALTEGTPFCPQCGAAQIKVAAPSLEPAADESAPLPAQHEDIDIPGEPSPSARRDRWIAATIPGLLLGALAPILFLYLKFGYVLFLVGGGAIAVVLFRHRTRQARVAVGSGASLGALTGAISFAVYALIIAISTFINIVVLRKGSEMAAGIRQVLDQAVRDNPDPQAQALIQKLTTPEGLAVLMTISVVMLLLVMLLSGTIGGMLGAAFGSRRDD